MRNAGVEAVLCSDLLQAAAKAATRGWIADAAVRPAVEAQTGAAVRAEVAAQTGAA